MTCAKKKKAQVMHRAASRDNLQCAVRQIDNSGNHHRLSGFRFIGGGSLTRLRTSQVFIPPLVEDLYSGSVSHYILSETVSGVQCMCPTSSAYF